MVPLEIELAWSGCRLSGRAFRKLVIRQFGARFSTWEPADLRRHPEAARHFCERVRAAAGSESLPESLIWDVLLRLAHSTKLLAPAPDAGN
jgi:hypothetical protein